MSHCNSKPQFHLSFAILHPFHSLSFYRLFHIAHFYPLSLSVFQQTILIITFLQHSFTLIILSTALLLLTVFNFSLFKKLPVCLCFPLFQNFSIIATSQTLFSPTVTLFPHSILSSHTPHTLTTTPR